MTDYPAALDALWAAHLAPRAPGAPTLVSLFSGCGGSSLGYSAAGFTEVMAAEWDKSAAAVFRANFPGVPLHEGDITQLDPAVLGLAPGELDLLDSSPPCPGFSMTGLRRQTDPRNELWHQVIRLATAWRPKVVVIENVRGLTTGPMRMVFRDICATLRDLGYTVAARLIDAMHLGVPQHRERVFIIGVRNDLGVAPLFPRPATRPVSVREGLADLDDPGEYLVPAGKGARVAAIVEPGKSGSEALAKRGGKAKHFSCKRLGWDRPSNTLVREIRPDTGSGFLHPSESRFLGINELARIQSFPGEWDWCGLDYEQTHHLIGNSVAPLVARAVGAALLPLLSAPKARSVASSQLSEP
jgi:DNA (cytosine-5)-methyltransferase 1